MSLTALICEYSIDFEIKSPMVDDICDQIKNTDPDDRLRYICLILAFVNQKKSKMLIEKLLEQNLIPNLEREKQLDNPQWYKELLMKY